MISTPTPVLPRRMDTIHTSNVGPCQNLEVPAGNEIVLQAHAEGVQTYRWNATDWTLVEPSGVLFADVGGVNAIVGAHYIGPTWQSFSGSRVVGRVLQSCVVASDAIPWLLLEAVSHAGSGIFDRVSYIQRMNTAGGKAPTDPGEFSGEEARVPYTAEYVFYRAQP